MPKASEHKSAEYVKLIFVGNSGAGKTGALASLVEAGYSLKIVDFDSGLDALINIIRESNPKLLEKVEYQTFRDQMKMGPTGPKVKGSPVAYVNGLGALEKWEDGTDPAGWGKDTVLILDSLTNIGRAAFQWARAMNPSSKDPRQWYKAAQDLVEDLIANVTSDAFETNVIVISHIEWTETQAGLTKGYASSIGKALGPKIPRFFNTMLMSEIKGSGKNMRRTIQTIPTSLIDLKNPAPMRIEAEYPIETGLADIFKKLKADS